MKKVHKLLALLLALSLCLAALPLPALAASPGYLAGEVVSEPEGVTPEESTTTREPGSVVSEPEEASEASETNPETTPESVAAPAPEPAKESPQTEAEPAETLSSPKDEVKMLTLIPREQGIMMASAETRTVQTGYLHTVYLSSFPNGKPASTGTWGSFTGASHMMETGGVYKAAYCLDEEKSYHTGSHTTNGTPMDDVNGAKRRIIGYIMANGFQWNGNSSTGDWSASDNDKWLATQLLIWAAMKGTSYVTIDNNTGLIAVSPAVRNDIVKISPCVYNADAFIAYYDSLVSSLEKVLMIPSFCTRGKISSEPRPENRKVIPAEPLKPITLKWNGSQYSAKTSDKNNTLRNYNFFNSIPGVKTSQNGNSLSLSTAAEINGVLSNQTDVIYQPRGGEGAVVAWKYAPEPSRYQRFASLQEATDPVPAILSVKTGDKPKDKEVRIYKTSEDGNISGIKFRVTGSDGFDKTYTTDAEGKIDIKGLPSHVQVPLLDESGNQLYDAETGEPLTTQGEPITYTVEEIDVPDLYIKPDPQSFTLVTESVVREFENIAKQWRVTISKRDSETGSAQGDASLSGARYGLYLNGKHLKTYTTNSSGKFTTDYYPCGSGYTIRELVPSTGYLLNPTGVTVGMAPGETNIEYNDTSKNVSEKVIKGQIRIIKHTDKGETGIETPEEGAEFQVFLSSAGSYENAGSTERDVLTIDKDGMAISKKLPYGLYTVHQSKGWEGTESVTDFQVFLCDNQETYSFILNNRVYDALITIMKKDAETGKVIPASGIGFKVKNVDTGEYVIQHINYPTPQDLSTFFTDVTGKLMMPEKLNHGHYELIEVATAYGYVLNQDPVPFGVDGTVKEVVVEKFNMPQKGVITIHKEGEVFQSVKQEGENGPYTPVYAVKGLPGAVFDIIAAEDIYTPDNTLRCSAGEVVDTITSDEDGYAVSQFLYLGKYMVVEKKAPAGCVASLTPKFVELSYAGQTEELSDTYLGVENVRQKASIDVLKSLEQDEAFGIGMNGEDQNVVFGLFAAETLIAADGTSIPEDGLISTAAVGESCKAVFNVDVPAGSYYMKEISTDDHYILSDEIFPVAFEYADQGSAVVYLHANNAQWVHNSLKRGEITGSKTDEDGLLLSGAVIGLFAPEETNFSAESAILTSTSTASGDFIFENVPYGSWVVREMESPEGFTLNEESYPVTVAEEDQKISVQIENKFIKGGVRLEKADAEYTGEKLSGAGFDVYADSNGNEEFDNGDVKVGTLTESETEKGVYTMDGLRYGGYFVVESTAPAYYELDPAPHYFEIRKDGEIIPLNVQDSPQLGNLLIKKTAEDGLVEGVRFTVTGSPYTGGQFQEEFETDENGEIHITGLRLGEYTVSEALDESTVRYIVEPDKTVTVSLGSTAEVTFYNKLKRGSIFVIKTDPDYPERRLEGASFKVYQDAAMDGEFDSKGDTFYCNLEGDKGIYWVDGLPAGSYLLHEEKAPEGYLPDTKYYPFDITEDTKQIEITNTTDPDAGFVNRKITGSLKIVKNAAGSGTLLSGANFCIKNTDGEVIAEGTTDQNGELVFDKLEYGSYTYQEICAPAGYETDSTTHSFKITKENQVVEVTVENSQTPFYVPQTGDGRINPTFMILLLIVLLAGAGGLTTYLVWNKKRISK